NLAALLRELERFLNECDETTADTIADFFALHPAAEALGQGFPDVSAPQRYAQMALVGVDVARLLDRLELAGSEKQVTALVERAAVHAPLDDPSIVARMLRRLRQAGAQKQAAALVERLPAAGHFDQFIRIVDQRERFSFGREPNGSAAAPWTWDDLE
ncbi:hypothetical protein EAO75_45480, partial [Streptomyces sp. uw30]|uniref:hypothetical protein n=1 Tax=Streptomyces sp. uw30 TaxID=1828179 RepID=UPI0013063FDF